MTEMPSWCKKYEIALAQADYFSTLLREYHDKGMSVHDIAEETGWSTTTIYNRLALMYIDPAVRESLKAGGITTTDAVRVGRQLKKHGHAEVVNRVRM